MNLTRRSFAGAIGMGMLAGTAGVSGFLVGGCNAAGVWSDIKVWLPTGIASFEAIMDLVAPVAAPGIDAIAEAVKAAFAVLAAAVDQYIAAPAADKTTWLQKVQTAFKAVTDNIQAFLTAVGQSSNPVVKLVLTLANIILSTIAAFLAKIGPTPPAIKLQGVVVVPVLRNRKSFVSDFNQACVSAGHPEASIN